MRGVIKGNCKRCGGPFECKRRSQVYCSIQCANTALADKASDRMATIQATTAWSCGGGVDSTAIAMLIIEGKLPKPDLAWMVDVGWEKSSTWDHVTQVLRPRLKEVGVWLHVIKTTDYTDNKLLDAKGYVKIPAYRRVDGKVMKLSTRCSGPWKVSVAKRWLREQGVEKCENWIGIATEESRRAKPSRDKWFGHRWPLIELGLTRGDCLYMVGQNGWPMPPRTSCVMCPQQTNSEWQRMAQHEPQEDHTGQYLVGRALCRSR
ncbi:hypothetical protein LCGC14_2414710 [marine sediment metagenome]|uniref:Phosphoadenosine phosphosulphate reductase domain-containing protein n=1 Tax=marine sediment metagenome TaxID=412755 RepID=A0A0F9BRH4_9ZZZZ